MLQNLPIVLFGISLIFYLLCLFLCFLDIGGGNRGAMAPLKFEASP